MAKKIVGELLVETLIAAGVKRVFGLAGDSLNGITDCVRTNQAITWVPVRHEEVAAFAAGAEAHLTGSLAVCAGTCGPGNMHLINGLYDCHRSRVPETAGKCGDVHRAQAERASVGRWKNQRCAGGD